MYVCLQTRNQPSPRFNSESGLLPHVYGSLIYLLTLIVVGGPIRDDVGMKTIRTRSIHRLLSVALIAALWVGMATGTTAQTPESIPPSEYQETGNEILKPGERDLRARAEDTEWSLAGLSIAVFCILLALAYIRAAPDHWLLKLGRFRHYPVYVLLLAAGACILLSMPGT